MKAVFLLRDISSDELPQIMACFSTQEKAQQYRRRLMTRSDGWNEYDIIKEEIDPECEGERT